MKSRALWWLVVLAGCGGTDAPQGWHVVFDDLEAPVLSAWTAPSGRTFFVGGAPEAGLILASDGHNWERMAVANAPRLWWVFGFSDDDVWAVGEHGAVLFYDGVLWRYAVSATSGTLYGVWGTSDQEMWAVGQGGVVMHRGPLAWDLEATGLPDEGDLYKVWGADGVVYAVGERGNILRRDASGWTRMTSGTTETLRTVVGRAANDVWAVGGQQGPVALHFDGQSWTEMGPMFGAPLVGVTLDASVWATSATGELFERTGDAWTQIDLGLPASLHFVAIGSGGRRFAGGGTTDGHGVLVAYGDASRNAITGAPPARAPTGNPSGGTLGAGAACVSDPNGCMSGYLCYTLQYAAPICSHACATASDCDDLGAHACCTLPEGQILNNVCVPSGTSGCP